MGIVESYRRVTLSAVGSEEAQKDVVLSVEWRSA